MKYLITLMLFFTTLLATQIGLTPQNTTVTFKVRHLFFSTVQGRFGDLNGTCEISPQRKLEKLGGSVRVSSISTGSKKRDTHLVSDAFFDAQKYPLMTMRLQDVRGDKATASLTIRGVTRTIPLKITHETDGFILQGKISRKDFGLVWGKAVEATGAVVGDTVRIRIVLSGLF